MYIYMCLCVFTEFRFPSCLLSVVKLLLIFWANGEFLSLPVFFSKLQIEIVEEQTGNPDPKANFRLIIVQTELERFKYLVRSFLRARIAKVGCKPPCLLKYVFRGRSFSFF